MGKGGGSNPEQKGGAPVLSVSHLGPARLRSSTFVSVAVRSSPFLDVCHMIVKYHVTNFTDEDRWFQSKRLLIIKTKIPEKYLDNSSWLDKFWDLVLTNNSESISSLQVVLLLGKLEFHLITTPYCLTSWFPIFSRLLQSVYVKTLKCKF